MATVSSVAMWVGQHNGKLIIEWFGWEVFTTPSFFIILLITIIFILYISIKFIIRIIKTPFIIKKKMIDARLKKSENALYNGIIASSYGNKLEVNKNLILAKKYLKKTPLLLLLDLQNSILKKNTKNSFFILSNMLSYPDLKPLAIKGLITYANKNNDLELFSNMLDSSLDKKISVSWIIQDALNFCIEKNNWINLANFLEKKIDRKNKRDNYILSLINFKIANNLYLDNDNETALFYLEKSLKINRYFPAFIELYCKLKKVEYKEPLIKLLKKYWENHPSPNIENCINIGLDGVDELSKLKEATKMLVKHDNLYYKHLILGKLKYKAKIWGDAKKDFKESIRIKPTKSAYYYLYQMEKKISSDIINISKLKKLFSQFDEESNFLCSFCKIKLTSWDVFCNNCKQFDSINFSTKPISKNNSTKDSNQLLDSIKI
jgi:HemY protein